MPASPPAKLPASAQAVPGPGRHEVAVTAAEAGERLDRLLAARLPGLSRSRVKALIEAGRVSAGGATIVEPSARVKPGQTFAIILPEARSARPEAQPIALDIVYEDAALIVIDKPAGLVVHPAPGNPDRILLGESAIGGDSRPALQVIDTP